MKRRKIVFDYLDRHGIRYNWYEHPEAPTVEIARRYWEEHGDGSTPCKNLFLRNHKGDRHYLVCFHFERQLAIRDLEQRLHQGKLSFASEQRMERWLGLRPGSVSPFGLVNDPGTTCTSFSTPGCATAPRWPFIRTTTGDRRHRAG